MPGDKHSAVIVFAHGSRDPLWAEPLEALRDRLAKVLPEVLVRTAYQEFMQPTLAKCVSSLWQAGCRDIVVLPAFVAAGSHLREDLPILVEQARIGCEGVNIRLLPALGEILEVQSGIAEFVRKNL